MIFPNRTTSSKMGGTANRSRTPNKHPQGASLKMRKQLYKIQPPVSSTKQTQNTKYKSKDTMILLQGLEDIYNNLSFNEFDAFPIDNIVAARERISELYKFYKGQPTCPKHNDLLNLYCESDKEVICVSCVYKGSNQHKNHKIKALQAVQKTLDFQTIRNDQKCKALVHQLSQIKDQIQRMQRQVSEQYTVISNYTMRMFQDTVNELELLKRQMQKKLNLAFRRTTTVISRYREALDQMTNMIDSNLQKSISVGPLSKYLVLKSILDQGFLIDELIGKFNENKQLIQQWRRSTKQFQKTIVKKKFEPNHKVDTYIVTEF